MVESLPLCLIDSRMSSMAKRTPERANLLQGTLDMLILRTLHLWSCSRSPDRQAYSADHELFSPDAARLTFPRSAPAGAKGMGHLEMGDGSRSESGIQVLPAYR